MRVVGLVVIMLLGGCSESPQVKQAKALVADQFDYSSAVQFREVRQTDRAVCGKVSGRDVEGETGWRRFAVQGNSVIVEGKATYGWDRETQKTSARTQDVLLDVECA